MCTQNALVCCAGVCIAFTFHGIWNHDCIERRYRFRVDAMRKCPFWKWVSPIKYRITYLCAEIPKQWETVYGTAAIPFTQWQYPFYISAVLIKFSFNTHIVWRKQLATASHDYGTFYHYLLTTTCIVHLNETININTDQNSNTLLPFESYVCVCSADSVRKRGIPLPIHRLEFSIENHTNRQWIFRVKFCGLSKLKFDIHFVNIGDGEIGRMNKRTSAGRDGKTKRFNELSFRLSINSHARQCREFSLKVHILFISFFLCIGLSYFGTSIKCLHRLFWSNSIVNQIQNFLNTFSHVRLNFGSNLRSQHNILQSQFKYFNLFRLLHKLKLLNVPFLLWKRLRFTDV